LKTLSKATFGLVCLTGCYKNHLYVQQEWVDASFLASSHVGTPDPRQEHPPHGQRLLIAWDFPRSLFDEKLTLEITVRLWNNTQEVLLHPVERKRGYEALYFPNADPCDDRRILTYRIQVLNAEGTVLETWKHHFWTELIEINR
jgi:hypothetical protein